MIACGGSTGATANKVEENHIDMKSIDGSDIQVPADTRLVCTPGTVLERSRLRQKAES